MQFIQLMKQDIKNFVTNPVVILFCTVYPLVLIGLFGFLFASQYAGEITSYDFYGVAMMFYIILASSTITPILFMEKRVEQANLRITYAPVALWKIYTSKLLVCFLLMGDIYALDIWILNAYGIVNFGGTQVFYIMGLYGALLLFSISFGGMVCTLLKNQDLTNKIIGAVANTLALFSGVFFPIASLGDFASRIANSIPIKWVLDTLFQVIYDQNFSRYFMTIGTCFVLTIFCIFIIHKKYKTIGGNV